MVKGLDTFRKYFAEYESQYVLIGGAACDIVFESHESEALRLHMQKVQEQIQHAKDVPKELFDIDFHKLSGQH